MSKHERRQQILEATRDLLARKGMNVTMDEVAEASGVGRRTLFRYYPTREELLAATIERGYARLRGGLYDPTGAEEQHPDDLLQRVFATAHRVASVAGLGVWQLASDPEVSGELQKAASARRTFRHEYVRRFTQQLWSVAGGREAPPQWVTDAFALLESLFTYHAMHLDFGRSPEEVAELAARMMSAVLRAALEESSQEAAYVGNSEGMGGGEDTSRQHVSKARGTGKRTTRATVLQRGRQRSPARTAPRT